jgi:pimeloyl-ACP methyl ester carboxylesterase
MLWRIGKPDMFGLSTRSLTMSGCIAFDRRRFLYAAADLEKRLAESPVITVPAISMERDANGAPYPEPSAYAKKFSGRYEHRLITGGIGHNLPQEAPQAFAEAVIDIAQS